MIVASLSDAARHFGARTIFSGLTWAIQDGEKTGLVGPSGIGKSTLLRTLAGLDKPEGGTFTLRRGAKVAYLGQEFAGDPGRAALDELLSGHDEIEAIERHLSDLEEQMGDQAVLDDPAQFDRVLAEHERLLHDFEAAGGPMLRNQAEGLLRELGIQESSWGTPMAQLSGGQRKLIGLARCILSRPDLLLLDEPDNHLDLGRKAMLENVIRAFPGAVVVISHDRYFLDETVGQIAEMEPIRGAEGARLARWEGNYSSYATQKELALLKQQQDFVAQQKEISRLEEAIARFKLWASIVIDERHIKQARNKQRQIDRMDKVERPVLERRKMRLAFRASERGGQKVVDLRAVSKGFGGPPVIEAANATVMNGERVGIVGGNGAGKSVLLRMVLGLVVPDAGEVWIGPSITPGYYAQEHETLDLSQTPIEAMRGVKAMYEGDAVSYLGRFLIPYETSRQPIRTLSGGEKSRIQLARLMLSGANCLLLDEPTNNLDIPACEVLEAALDAYNGTIVVVSHDRYFLDRVVDRIFEIEGGRLRVYDGSHSFYAERKVLEVAPVVSRSTRTGA